MTNPYAQYKQQALSTLTPGEIVIKMFDESLKQLHSAVSFIEAKDFSGANASLVKTQKLFAYLSASLDMRFPISEQLSSLYEFISRELVRANTRKDAQIIDSILPLVEELRDTFKQADKLSRIK